MKKILLATMAMIALSATAFAADIRTYSKAPMPEAAYNWSGFYVGGVAGWTSGNFDPSTSTTFNDTYFGSVNVPGINAAGVQRVRPSGFAGGLEVGSNWQSGKFVLGIEGDIESFRLRGNASSTALYAGAQAGSVCPVSCFTINSSSSTSWLATARARLGVASNNWLFFVTGGAAFTELNSSFSFADFYNAASPISFSNTKMGYTVGGGVETAIASNWTVKAEYLYVNFGSVSAAGALSNSPDQPIFHSLDLKANLVRLGLNHKFN
jgi:outer membrane immunogenic protein